jgi:hypothetical protein
MVRCVECGCSRWDAGGVGCVLCGGSPATRWEKVHISCETQANLEGSFPDLKTFGVTVEQMRVGEILQKPAGGPEEKRHSIALDFSEPIEPKPLQELVSHLHSLGIPKSEIFRLRLAEPEEIEAGLAAKV